MYQLESGLQVSHPCSLHLISSLQLPYSMFQFHILQSVAILHRVTISGPEARPQWQWTWKRRVCVYQECTLKKKICLNQYICLWYIMFTSQPHETRATTSSSTQPLPRHFLRY